MTTRVVFGHQPCGFIPKNFLVVKIKTAIRIAAETGGKPIFFYHDSDHDYRETITEVYDRQNNKPFRLNFEQENKIQKKYSPLYAKRIPDGWQKHMLEQLPRFADQDFIEIFQSVDADNVADFCLDIYKKMGFLDNVEVFRSSSSKFREAAIDLKEPYFVDVDYEGEIARAKKENGLLHIHRGGGKFIELPNVEYSKKQISPHSSNRLAWMQSVVKATHYIMGSGEDSYLKREDAPEITFVMRDAADDLLKPVLHPVSL